MGEAIGHRPYLILNMAYGLWPIMAYGLWHMPEAYELKKENLGNTGS
jgi:hypothetical protein